ncbi:alpha/beta fold hydrolase [Saccharopolyspora rhizosphaerae]|uniref:Alpha/beta fold hydrolase n=1 Tax=Saccharopolyspora rhizosphaerae TaxID=2492662 RepID=A0A3R8Q2L5_9PSEU|nr:alpha/beta fold hydrolase [Saccharopolyspora rhizosphaerae]RRO15600.1 alpha/beta fold hydrolase [Saccharopolyspora rhizosphaerae]
MTTRATDVHPQRSSRRNRLDRAALTRVPLVDGLPELDPHLRPPQGRQVDLPATGSSAAARLHVRETEGPAGAETAVHLHGLAGSSTNWTDLSAQLAGHLRSVAVDLPGFGHSQPPAGFGYTRQENADQVIRLLTELRTGPVHLTGNSFGAAVAIEVAARRPDLVNTLTLIAPAVPDLRPSPSRMSDPRLALAMLPLVGTPTRRKLAQTTPRQRAEQLIRLCFAEPGRIPPHRLDEAAAEFAERADLPWAAAALARTTAELMRSWVVSPGRSLWRLLPRVDAPALVIWGANDRVVSVRKAPRTTTLLPRGRLLVIPRTGHVPQMERPAVVARAVLGLALSDTW